MPASDVKLGWTTFTAAAEQAGISRIYGGIHFDAANLAGLAMGRRIGRPGLRQGAAHVAGPGMKALPAGRIGADAGHDELGDQIAAASERMAR